MARRFSRLTAGNATVVGSFEVGVKKRSNGTFVSNTTDAYFKLPKLTTTQRNALTVSEGMVVYDTTLGKEMIYRAGGWGASDGTAAGSLDAAYNGGSTLAVDAANVLLNLSDASNDYHLEIDNTSAGVISDTLKITSTGGGSSITDAIDVSASAIVNAVNVGANTITGTTAVIDFDNFDVDGTGNVTVGGTLGVTGATTLSSTLAAGNTTITGTIAVSSTVTSQGGVIIDIDDNEAFLIRRNGDAADILTVDTTAAAGDTTMLLTTKSTTGTGLHVDGTTITSGDAIKVTVISGTMTAGGSAISVVDNATEVFAVRDDGSIYSKSTAEGTTAFQVATGDVVISDGDFTVAGGESAFTDGITTANVGFAINTSATTAGVGAGVAGAVVITANSLTTGTALVVRADAITTGDMLYLDAGGATMTLGSGFYINCNDDNSSKFTVSLDGTTVIAGTAAGTAVLTLSLGDLSIVDTDASMVASVNGTTTLFTLDNQGGVIASGSAVLLVDAGGAVASGGNLLRVAPTGTPNAGAIAIEVVGASKTCQMMYVDGDSTAASVVKVNGGGALTDNLAVLELTNDGNLATGGNVLRVSMGGTPHTAAAALEIAAVKDAYALYIASGNATNSGVYVTSNGAVADNKAVLEIVATGTPAAAGSNLVRIDASGLTATNKPIMLELVGTGKDVSGMYSVSDNTTTHGVSIAGAGALNAGRMLVVTNTGTPAANTDTVAEFTFGGTATNNPIVASINNGTANALPLMVNSNVAAATREVAMFVQDSTTGANEVLSLQQDDLDQPFIDFVTTIGTGNAVEAIAAKTLTTTHFVMVKVPGGLVRYFPVGTIA